ncbi:protein white-like isoform X2, partial [Leptotrombidium deliense]
KSNEKNNAICEAYKQSEFAKQIHIDVNKPHFFKSQYKASIWTQFHVLLRRTWKNNIRENMFLFVLIEELIGALIFGYLFSRQTLNQTGVKNLNGALFFLVVTLLYQLVFVELRMFFEEIDLVYREFDSNLYTVTAYFWAYSMAAMPAQLLSAIQFSVIFYLVVGFGGSFVTWVNYTLISIVMSQAVISFVYLISCFLLNLILTIKVITTLFSLLFLLSGMLIDYATIPSFLEFMKYLSFTYLANEAYVVNQWSKVDNISCVVLRTPSNTRNSTGETQGACLDNGMKVIDSFNYNPDNLEFDIGFLFAIFIGYRVLANVVFCLRLKRISVSGEIQSGLILAIMGSSGAGKTTLLNVLSGRQMPGFRVEGTVAINGRVTDFQTIKALSAYVQQEDMFLGNITVREH